MGFEPRFGYGRVSTRSVLTAIHRKDSKELGLPGMGGCAFLALSVSPNRVNRLVAARALAALMAGALLVFTWLATSGRFHQAFHCGGTPTSSTCILCLFVKGHLDAAPSVPFTAPALQPAADPAPRN